MVFFTLSEKISSPRKMDCTEQLKRDLSIWRKCGTEIYLESRIDVHSDLAYESNEAIFLTKCHTTYVAC